MTANVPATIEAHRARLKSLAVDGGAIAYLEEGPGDGEVVLPADPALLGSREPPVGQRDDATREHQLGDLRRTRPQRVRTLRSGSEQV